MQILTLKFLTGILKVTSKSLPFQEQGIYLELWPEIASSYASVRPTVTAHNLIIAPFVVWI